MTLFLWHCGECGATAVGRTVAEWRAIRFEHGRRTGHWRGQESVVRYETKSELRRLLRAGVG